jgi:hypothetical protein
MTQDLKKGIIVGCCAKQEYLLPYFYLNLRLHTDLPITFFDFGMSPFGRSFCEKRGQLIVLSDSIKKGLSLDPLYIIKKGWFKKPLACSQSPFDLTIWLDLDCKIHKNFEAIFDKLQNNHFAIAKSPKETKHGFCRKLLKKRLKELVFYNSGVIAFKKDSPIIKEWIQYSEKMHAICRGDEDTLSYLLSLRKHPFSVLDACYNHIPVHGQSKDPVITHYISRFKELLLKEYTHLESLIN